VKADWSSSVKTLMFAESTDGGAAAALPASQPFSGRTARLLIAEGNGRSAGLRVRGEIDCSVHLAWVQVLLHAVAQPSGDVHLDMTGLEFIDVRGTALLVQTAMALPNGRRLVLHRPPECLRKILQTIWPDGAPGVRIEEEAR
jgi:anti-anti-sigma factor